MQIRFGGILGDAQQHRHFVNSHAEPIIKTQGRLVDIGERENALRQSSIALRRFQLPVRARPRSDGAIKDRLVRMRAAEANPRFQVHCLVESYAVNPGTKFGLAAKRANGVVNLEKHLLRDVFRFGNELPAQNRNRETKHGAAMPANQFSESLLVAVLRTGHELGVTVHKRFNAQARLSENGRRSSPHPEKRAAEEIPKHYATEREASDRARSWLLRKDLKKRFP